MIIIFFKAKLNTLNNFNTSLRSLIIRSLGKKYSYQENNYILALLISPLARRYILLTQSQDISRLYERRKINGE